VEKRIRVRERCRALASLALTCRPLRLFSSLHYLFHRSLLFFTGLTLFASSGIVNFTMSDRGPETPVRTKFVREGRERLREYLDWQRPDLKATTPEEQKREMGLLVKDARSGDPINFIVSQKYESKLRDVPLRVTAKLPAQQTLAMFSSDGRNAYFFRVDTPMRMANGSEASEFEYIRPLQRGEVRGIKAHDYKNIEDYLSTQTQELLKDQVLVGMSVGEKVPTASLPTEPAR